MFRPLFPFLSLVATSALLLLASPVARAATLSCIPSASPQIVHGEGITERTGDIVLACSGGTASATVTVNFVIFLNVNITNRLTAATSNILSGLAFTADNGSGPQAIAAPPTLMGPGTVAFNGAVFTLSPSGSVSLRLAGLRGAANNLDFNPSESLQVLMNLNPANVPSGPLTVGEIQHGLYVGSPGVLVCTQQGSPLPQNVLSFASFLAAGSAFATTRVTEGFAESFAPKSDPQNFNADTGTRIVVQYS